MGGTDGRASVGDACGLVGSFWSSCIFLTCLAFPYFLLRFFAFCFKKSRCFSSSDSFSACIKSCRSGSSAGIVSALELVNDFS